MRKILICTTFRDFNGNENAKIQELFLEGLKRQTFSDWELIVTIFKEQNVEQTLKRLAIPYRAHYAKDFDYRFSSSEVLDNCVAAIDQSNQAIVIWTTCDVLLDPEFLQTVIDQFRPRFCATTSPHVVYESVANYQANHRPAHFFEGLDMLIFDGDLLLLPEVVVLTKKYRFVDWGAFEFFLAGLGIRYASKTINLWPQAKLAKIENDRLAAGEGGYYLRASKNKNEPTLRQFANEIGLPLRFPVGYNLIKCFKRPSGQLGHRVWQLAALGKFGIRLVGDRLSPRKSV